MIKNILKSIKKRKKGAGDSARCENCDPGVKFTRFEDVNLRPLQDSNNHKVSESDLTEACDEPEEECNGKRTPLLKWSASLDNLIKSCDALAKRKQCTKHSQDGDSDQIYLKHDNKINNQMEELDTTNMPDEEKVSLRIGPPKFGTTRRNSCFVSDKRKSKLIDFKDEHGKSDNVSSKAEIVDVNMHKEGYKKMMAKKLKESSHLSEALSNAASKNVLNSEKEMHNQKKNTYDSYSKNSPELSLYLILAESFQEDNPELEKSTLPFDTTCPSAISFVDQTQNCSKKAPQCSGELHKDQILHSTFDQRDKKQSPSRECMDISAIEPFHKIESDTVDKKYSKSSLNFSDCPNEGETINFSSTLNTTEYSVQLDNVEESLRFATTEKSRVNNLERELENKIHIVDDLNYELKCELLKAKSKLLSLHMKATTHFYDIFKAEATDASQWSVIAFSFNHNKSSAGFTLEADEFNHPYIARLGFNRFLRKEDRFLEINGVLAITMSSQDVLKLFESLEDGALVKVVVLRKVKSDIAKEDESRSLESVFEEIEELKKQNEIMKSEIEALRICEGNRIIIS